MEETLTLHQAGDRLGVEHSTLQRLIRVGALPEAHRVVGPDGPAWVIPSDALTVVADRQGWVIDLRDDRSGATADESGSPAAIENDATPEPDRLDEQAAATGGALVPHQPQPPVPAGEDAGATDGGEGSGPPSVSEVLDLALLDRLLGAQEDRATAVAEAKEAQGSLTVLKRDYGRVNDELDVERRERLVATDRYREERTARVVSDAKVAELRDRVVREMALAESEKDARVEAMTRTLQAERDAADAFAAMGWLARRRYRRLNRRRRID